MLTIKELAAALNCSDAQVSRLMSAGLPFVDLRVQRRPGTRHKRCPRFDLAEVTKWMQERRSA